MIALDDLSAKLAPVHPGQDRIVVIGGAEDTLDVLRLATVRSDDVVLVMDRPDSRIRRFIDHFAVELRARRPLDQDLAGASAALIAAGETNVENAVVRAARRRGIPVFVSGRPLLSDFSLIELLERKPSSFAAEEQSAPRKRA